jgi:oxygen-dependent protoporphyrinogen oxidase
MNSPAVAIVGGGISGLAAAYELRQRGVPFVLFERLPACGGVVRTERVDGYTIDAGPDALLTQKRAAIDLCDELGLAGGLCSQVGRATFIVRNGSLRELPATSVLGLPTRWQPFLTSRAFSWRGKLRIAADLFVPRGEALDDESIGSFIGRRFGREAVDLLAEPLLAGIHGGDPARLSMRAAFPRLLELERRHGSVIAGLRATGFSKTSSSSARSPFVALPGGMGELTTALVNRIGAGSIRAGVGVEEILEREGGGYRLSLTDGSHIHAPNLILATPPATTARLLKDVDSELSASCSQIRSASVVTVALGYARSAIRHPLDGAGLVVPRRERLNIRALSWVSSKWNGRAPADRVLLRAYVGGVLDPGAIDQSDRELIDVVCRDVNRLLGAVGEPEMVRIYRWRGATPQIEVGHAGLMGRIDRRLADRPGLAVTASGFRGTGIADCVADARSQAARLAERTPAALSA